MSSKLYCKQIKILFMCISLRNKIIIGDWIFVYNYYKSVEIERSVARGHLPFP